MRWVYVICGTFRYNRNQLQAINHDFGWPTNIYGIQKKSIHVFEKSVRWVYVICGTFIALTCYVFPQCRMLKKDFINRGCLLVLQKGVHDKYSLQWFFEPFEHTVQCDYNLHAWMCHQVFRYNSVVIWLRFQICCNKCCYIRIWSFQEKIFTSLLYTTLFTCQMWLKLQQRKSCSSFLSFFVNITLVMALKDSWKLYFSRRKSDWDYLDINRI